MIYTDMNEEDLLKLNKKIEAAISDIEEIRYSISKKIGSGSVLSASSGNIGGFYLGEDNIRDAANSMGISANISAGDDVRFWAGATFANRATAPFRVTEAGAVTASSLTITGGTTGDYQVFTSSGTWTKPTGATANSTVIVQVWGAGGSDGGASGANFGGGGGGVGGYSTATFRASELGSTETVTVAAATAVGADDAAGGGDSSFGTKLIGYGGGGGGGG